MEENGLLNIISMEVLRGDYWFLETNKSDTDILMLMILLSLLMSSSYVKNLKDIFNQCFHMKDLEKLRFFLGIEVAQNSWYFFYVKCVLF